MFKGLRNKALKVNLKKWFMGLLIACIVFAAGSGVALYLNFGDRVAQLKDAVGQKQEQVTQVTEDNGTDLSAKSICYAGNKHGNGRIMDGKGVFSGKRGKTGYRFDSDFEWNLTTGDKVMIGSVMGIGAVLGVIYWLLCMVWAYRKSDKLGSNSALWVIATLFLNLWAVAGLYIYAGFTKTCKKCGHRKQKGEKYCSHCGNAYETLCESCQTVVPADAAYCPNCGKPVRKTDADNE